MFRIVTNIVLLNFNEDNFYEIGRSKNLTSSVQSVKDQNVFY